MAVNLRTFVHTGGLLPGGIAGLTVLVQGIFQRFFGMDVPYGRLYLALNCPECISDSAGSPEDREKVHSLFLYHNRRCHNPDGNPADDDDYL